ncbi:hypothetical protein QQF64_032024 [Cirrhinus molitorella]|uniref:Uncharacterized protein n=1 Tax=Cirrhinus molitorella TaxID=172907 RepID=A0ABR3MYM9_9TELE
MKQAPGQQPALSPSGKMEPKSLFSLHKALAQPVKMCMFDFPVSILDDLLFESTRVRQGQCFGVSEWRRRILGFISITRLRISCSFCDKDSIEKVMCWKDKIDQLIQVIRWCGLGCLYVNEPLYCDLEGLEERKQVDTGLLGEENIVC